MGLAEQSNGGGQGGGQIGRLSGHTNHGSASAQDGAVADTRSLLTVIRMSSQTHPHSVQATSEWMQGAEGRVESFKVLYRSGLGDLMRPAPESGPAISASRVWGKCQGNTGILGRLCWTNGDHLVD
jgi:hypothetical protein